jgi:hypothetical protein
MSDNTTRPEWLTGPGEYRTRDGRKAIVYAVDAPMDQPIFGVLTQSGGNYATTWNADGGYSCHANECSSDLIGRWVEPVTMDWTALPKWARWIACDSFGLWKYHSFQPNRYGTGWQCPEPYSGNIPLDESPKWRGNWRESLTAVPGRVTP